MGEEAAYVLTLLRDDAETAHKHYLELLNEETPGHSQDRERRGLARELARMNLTLNFYTQWYWKIDLHNFMRFIDLRADAHAQYEIRAYAELLLNILERWVPLTAEAFREHRLGAVTLSATAVRAVKDTISGRQLTADTSGLTQREWNALKRLFGI